MITLAASLVTLWLWQVGERLEVPVWPLVAGVSILLLVVNHKI